MPRPEKRCATEQLRGKSRPRLNCQKDYFCSIGKCKPLLTAPRLVQRSFSVGKATEKAYSFSTIRNLFLKALYYVRVQLPAHRNLMVALLLSPFPQINYRQRTLFVLWPP